MAEKPPKPPSHTEDGLKAPIVIPHITRIERDATPAEMREANEEAVEELELRPDPELPLKAQKWYRELKEEVKPGLAEKRKAAEEALEAREGPLKDFLAVQRRLKVEKRNLNPQEADEYATARKEFEKAKKANLEAQLAYAAELQGSVKKRLENRGFSKERIDEITARYNRLIRVREIVIPAKEQELKVREQVLDESGRNVFQKALKWNADLTKRMERGVETLIKKIPGSEKWSKATVERVSRNGARAARLIGFATAGTGIGLLAGGPAAAALITAAAGRAAFGLGSIGAGAAAGYGWGKGFEATKGKERRESFRAAQRRKITSERDLEEQVREYSSGSDAAIEAARIQREKMGALIAGLGVSSSVLLEEGSLEAVRGAGQLLHSLLGGHRFTIPDIRLPEIHLPDIFGHHAATHTLPTHTQELHTQPAHIGSSYQFGSSTEIHGTVNDADRLFGHLRDDLQHKVDTLHANGKDVPPALRTFLGLPKDQNGLTKALGFQREGWSALMHKGDSLLYSDKTHELIFHKAGDAGPGTVVIDAHGQVNHAGISGLFAEHHAHATPHHHHHAQAAEHHPQPTHHEHATHHLESMKENAASAPVEPAEAATVPVTHPIEAPPHEDSGLTTLGQMVGQVSSDHAAETVSHGPDVSTTLGDMVHSEHLSTITSATDAAVNIHDISVPLDSTHEYVWKLPGTSNEQLFAFGGTPKAASDMAQRFVAMHPNSSMMFISEKRGLFGLGAVKRTISAWVSDAHGQVRLLPEAVDQHGKPLALPTSDDFISRIDQ